MKFTTKTDLKKKKKKKKMMMVKKKKKKKKTEIGPFINLFALTPVNQSASHAMDPVSPVQKLKGTKVTGKQPVPRYSIDIPILHSCTLY